MHARVILVSQQQLQQRRARQPGASCNQRHALPGLGFHCHEPDLQHCDLDRRIVNAATAPGQAVAPDHDYTVVLHPCDGFQS